MSTSPTRPTVALQLYCTGRTDNPSIPHSNFSNIVRSTTLSEAYDIHLAFTISKVHEIEETLNFASLRGRVRVLVIHGHGRSREIEVGDSETLTPEFPKKLFSALPKGARVFLVSCCRDGKNILAQRIALKTHTLVTCIEHNPLYPWFAPFLPNERGDVEFHILNTQAQPGALPAPSNLSPATTLYLPNGRKMRPQRSAMSILIQAKERGYPVGFLSSMPAGFPISLVDPIHDKDTEAEYWRKVLAKRIAS